MVDHIFRYQSRLINHLWNWQRGVMVLSSYLQNGQQNVADSRYIMVYDLQCYNYILYKCINVIISYTISFPERLDREYSKV